MRRALLLAAVLVLVLLPIRADAPPDKDWTLLVYLDADNNLEAVGIDDFLEMSAVGSTNEVNVVVQFDRSPNSGPGYSTAYGDWSDTRRFYVTPGMVPIPGSEVMTLGEVDMADPATLVSFVNWGIANYPARHYFLVLWDHGDGWQGVVVDNDPVPSGILTAMDLRTALSSIVAANGRRVDLLGNDACRMSIEIQYEIADYVEYFVGSEKDEPLEGWPYDALLAALVANPAMTPAEVASALVDEYVDSYVDNSLYSVALSAINAAGLRPLVSQLNTFLDELEVHQPYFTEQVLSARIATERYERAGECCGDEYDLFHFVENLLAEIPSRRLERSGTSLLAAIEAAVVYERHWDHPNPVNNVPARNAHGLSIWFPTLPDPTYGLLAFSTDSQWDEFLASYAIGTRPQVAANATATVRDGNGDGYTDESVLAFAPAVNGTMAVDVYRDGEYVFSREYAAFAGRSDVVRYRFITGGVYEVTFYLLDAGDLVNLTVVADLPIEELITFRGRVTGLDGVLLDGAEVTLVNRRTGERATTTTNAGDYTIRVPYPTWFRAGDPLALEVNAGEVRATLSFDSDLPPNRVFVRDVFVNTAGNAVWFVALAILAAVAAAGVGSGVYFWWRLRRFKRPPET